MKKTILLIFIGIASAAIAIGFFLQYTRTRKTAEKASAVIDKAAVNKAAEVASPASPPLNEKSEIQDTTDQKKEAAKQAAVSALLKAMTGRSQMKGLSEEELVRILLDKNASPKNRYHAAWALAKSGSEEALGEIEKIFSQKGTEAYIKAAVAEGLGYSSNPRAKPILLNMLEDENEIVVRGAIRGLSAIGDQDAVFRLSGILNSNGASKNIIAEAAMGLGKIASPDACLALISAYQNAEASNNDTLKQDIISAMGYRDISETEAFFQNILNQTDADASLRLTAIEALEEAQGDTGAFLANYLNDADSEIRAEAAWALASADAPGDLADAIESRLAIEEDAEVRKRLYQALGNQENPDLDAGAEFVFKETDLEARLAGYDLLARGLKGSENTALAERFTTTAIPELREMALSDENLNLKLSAVTTLKRAGTAESLSALKEIAAKSLDYRVVKATGLNK